MRIALLLCETIFLMAAFVLNLGCVAVVPAVAAGIYASSLQAPDIPEMPAAQKRAMQTRDFETSDKQLIFTGVMSALQDQDFVIDQTSMDAGLVTGHKNLDIGEANELFAATFARVATGIAFSGSKRSVITASLTVREIRGEDRIRVRSNFEGQTFGDNGNLKRTAPVMEQQFYQEFFSKLSKAVFLDAVQYGDSQNSLDEPSEEVEPSDEVEPLDVVEPSDEVELSEVSEPSNEIENVRREE